MSLFATLAALLLGAGTAKADTGDGHVGHVWMTLSGTGTQQQSQYAGLLQSLQNAAGHGWEGFMATQTHSNSLIRMDLTFGGETLYLWFTPNNLYLRGFTNHYGDTWQFNDYNLEDAFERLANSRSPEAYLLPNVSQVRTLSYGSDYNDMVNAADGRDRGNMPISYNDLWNTVWQLQYGANGSSTAASLMWMVQYTSEAARFWDVYGVMSAIMGSDVAHYDGLPLRHQEIENSWDGLSRYASAYFAGQNPSPYYMGPHAGNVSNVSQLRSVLWTNLGDPSQASSTGDWWHTEL